MTEPSRTDWNRLFQQQDQDIDTSDIPDLDEAFFQQAQVQAPPNNASIDSV